MDTTYLQYYPTAAEIQFTESKLWCAAAGFTRGSQQHDIRHTLQVSFLKVSFSSVATTSLLIISTPLTGLLLGGGSRWQINFLYLAAEKHYSQGKHARGKPQM